MTTEREARWDAEVRPALEQIADTISPLVPPYHAAFAAIGKTDMTGEEELAALASARSALNAATEAHIAEIARLTGNAEDNIRMLGKPKDDFDPWFAPSWGDPAEFLRNVGRFRSFNTNYWTSQGWLGYGKGIDLPPAQRLARERAELEAQGVDFTIPWHQLTHAMQRTLEQVGTARGYGPSDMSGSAGTRYFRHILESASDTLKQFAQTQEDTGDRDPSRPREVAR